MPTDPPPVDPRVETLPDLCEEEGATPEPTFPRIDSFHIEMSRYVCWNKSNTMHVNQFKMWQASLERKVDAVPPWLHK